MPRLELQQPHVHGLLGQRALRRRSEVQDGSADDAPLNVPRSLAAPSVGSRGAGVREAAAAKFGAQGEGAIEGVYTEYIVGALGQHTGTRFSRFLNCEDARVVSKVRVD